MKKIMFTAEFYLLNSTNEKLVNWQACQLAKQAFAKHQQVFILVDARAQALELDNLLWTFEDISFIPHAIKENENLELKNLPILIGWQLPPQTESKFALLINLTPHLVQSYDFFEKLVEIVSKNEEDLLRARQHYRCYKQAGAELVHHQLT